MSTTKEQMQDIDNQRLNKIILFLRVCYRHKCRLRSFECFPSFQELINVIIKLYPSIKSQISSSSNKDKNKNRIPKRSTNKHHDQCWRLETNESDWIENDNDWNVIIQYLKHSKLNKNVAEKSKISSNGNDKEENDTSSNHNKKESEMKHNNDPINLTLRLIIQDPGNDAYDPRKPSTMQNYKNPSSLSNERYVKLFYEIRICVKIQEISVFFSSI